MRAIGLVLLLLAGLAAHPARAQDDAPGLPPQEAARAALHTLAVRGVPLHEALAALVRVTGIELAYDARLVTGRRAWCARADAPAEALLACVLHGTGLDFVRASSGTYVLMRAVRAPTPTARLAGRVVDGETGEPLPHASVLLADARAGTAADADGLFAFARLLPGRHRLVATYVGYTPATLDSVWVAPGGAEQVVVALHPEPVTAAPLVIDGLTERVPSAELGLGARAPADLAAAQTQGAPDVMRGAATVLGVSAALPLADLHVQGGSTAEHVTRLDGAPVRDPVALGRHLGAFSPLAVERVTVQKAGFGVEHGSLLAGTVDLQHALGDARPSAAAQVDPLSANLRVGAPVRVPGLGAGSAMAAVRASTWGLYEPASLTQLFDRWSGVDPVLAGLWLDEPLADGDLEHLAFAPHVAFSDVHLAARLRPDPFATLSASAYRARNHVDADRSVVAAPAAGPEAAYLFRDVYDWTNWAGQVRYGRLVGARALLAAQVRGAHHASGYTYYVGSGPVDDASAEATVAALAADLPLGAGASHRLTEAAAEATATLSLAPGWEAEALLGAGHTAASFDTEAGPYASPRTALPFTLDASGWTVHGYLRTRATLGVRWSAEGGTRLTYVPARQAVYAEPRAAVRYDAPLGPQGSFAARVAGGVYRQFVHGFGYRSTGPTSVVPELLFWLPTTGDLAPARAYHLAADVLLLPTAAWSIRAEAYGRWEPRAIGLDLPALWRSAFDDPDAASPAPLSLGTIARGVEGRSVGVGVQVGRTGARTRWTVAYSLERTRRPQPGRFEGRALPVPWATPHRLSADAHVRLGRGFGASAAGRGVWGRAWGYRAAYYDYLRGPYAPSEAAAVAALLDAPDADRLPALVAVDLGASYARTLAGVDVRLDLGVANVLDRANVYDWSRSSLSADGVPLARTLPGRRLFFALRLGR